MQCALVLYVYTFFGQSVSHSWDKFSNGARRDTTGTTSPVFASLPGELY